MKVAIQVLLMIVMAFSVMAYLGYGIAVLFTHQTLQQTIIPLAFGALVLAIVLWGLFLAIKRIGQPPRLQP